MDSHNTLTTGTDTMWQTLSLDHRRVLRTVGYLLAVTGIVVIVRNLSLPGLEIAIRNVHWIWLLAAIAADLSTYALQGQRWARLLRSLGSLRPTYATQAVFAGLFVNEIFPLRVGEVLRAYIAAARLKVGVLRIAPSIAIERLLDATCLIAFAFPLVLFVPLPSPIEMAVHRFAIAAAILIAFGVALVFSLRVLERRQKMSTCYTGLRARLGQFALDLREMTAGTQIAFPAILSLAMLLLQCLAFWLGMRAFHIDLPFDRALIAALIIRVGTAIPNAPGNVGTYQLFCVLALQMFGVASANAVNFSILMFGSLTLPLIIVGGWSVLKAKPLAIASLPQG